MAGRQPSDRLFEIKFDVAVDFEELAQSED
jgi:hypothetical protein